MHVEPLAMLDDVAIPAHVQEGSCHPDLLWPKFGEVLCSDHFCVFIFQVLVDDLSPYVWLLELILMPLCSILIILDLSPRHLCLAGDFRSAEW